MFNFETELVESISKRCTDLRSNSSFRQDDIADKSAISKIENMKYNEGDNFITHTVLEAYEITFNISKEEIIFGSESEFEELLLGFFNNMFRLVSRRNLDVDMHRYKKGAFSQLDIKLQRAVIALANFFGEYNIQRYNFLKSDETFMDCVNKEWDKTIYVGGKGYNIGRNCSSKPINEDTVIDIVDMEEKLWMICSDKFIRSFRQYLAKNLFNDFKYSSMNSVIYSWVEEQFIQHIVPDVVEKLKNNSIFKIGIMVKDLIERFLYEDIPESYQKTIPLQIKREKSVEINLNNDFEKFNLDTELKRKERAELFENLLKSGKFLVLSDEEKEEYEKIGIIIKEVPEYIETREVDIDAIIDQAIVTKYWGKSTSVPISTIESSPIYRSSDFNSFEEMRAFDRDWYDFTHFTNMNIPGYFTNNSQIMSRWQARLNEEIHEAIETFIIIQNNLLRLVTEKELRRFSK